MKYSYRKRIVSMLMACFLILSSLMPSLQVFSADKAVVHAETASSGDALGVENPDGETYTEGETTVEEVAVEEDTVTEEAANSNDTTSSNDSVNTDSTANKENKIYTEIKEKVKQSEEELKLAELARQGFYAVMSEDTDVAEVAVFSSSDESEIEVEVATETDAEEGLEVLESYTFGERDEKSEETLWVKADQGEEAELLPGESLSVYTVSDDKVEDVIIEDIAEEDELCEIDNEVTGIALVKDTGYRHLTFKIGPEGELEENSETDDKIVKLDGMMPKEASAEAVDVTELRTDSFNELSEEASLNDASESDALPAASLGDALEGSKIIAAYDITINNGDEEYQPGEERPIAVEINDSRIKADADLQLWHIKDDGTKEQVTDFTVEDGKVSFVAAGFSVYEIVEFSSEGPVIDWQKITDISLVTSLGDKGFYISNSNNSDNRYLNGGVLSNVSGNSDRYGLDSTTASSPVPQTAEKFYFEPAGSADSFYIYTIKNGVKNYIVLTSVSAKPSRGGLNLTTDSSLKTAFELHDIGEYFTVSGKVGTKEYYWNKNTNAPQSGAIAAFDDGTNTNTYRMNLWYSEDEPEDPYGLTTKSYGIMYSNGGNTGNALVAENPNYHSLPTLPVRDSGSGQNVLYVDEGSDISMWSFTFVSGDLYKLSTTVNGVTKYLKVESGGISFVDSVDDASDIKVIPLSGTDAGKIKLAVDNMYIYFDSTSESGGFGVSTDGTVTGCKLNFAKTSKTSGDETLVYSAREVSVSDLENVPNGAKVIVYTRVWYEDEENNIKEYRFYAIDQDGSLKECYERGDNIMWLDDAMNTLEWDFTEYYWDGTTDPNYYYELYNPASGLYLAPQVDGTVLSEEKVGINLNGRRNNEYYTDIVAWDERYYNFAGLKPNENATAVETCSLPHADTFYFAIMNPVVEEDDQLETIETVDNNAFGINMKLVNHTGTGTGSADSEVTKNYFGGDSGNTKGLLSTNIDPETGYPKVVKNGKNFGGAFANEFDVNHLFSQSVYDESGYFEYNSCQNFATIKDENGDISDEFTVYRQLGTTDASNQKSTLKHGQFFPFNTIVPGSISTKNPENLYSVFANYQNPAVGKLPESDPRYGEKLYTIEHDGEQPDYYLGMEMSAKFVQTPSGLDSWGHDMIFEFTGDDDFWLYVDDELVLDLGGIHSAEGGSVNFRTGEVYTKTVKDGEKWTTLYDIFYNNYKKRGMTAEEARAKVDRIFDTSEEGNKVFRDYSEHEMNLYYMERGAGASNLHLRFNLSSVTPGNVLLNKSLSGKDSKHIDFDLAKYPFQIWYKLDDESQSVHLLDPSDPLVKVKYQNTEKDVDFTSSYVPPGFSESEAIPNVFFLTADRNVEVKFPDGTIQYMLREIAVNNEVYDEISINGEASSETDWIPMPHGTKGYETEWAKADDVAHVNFDNHVTDGAIRTLEIKKYLHDAEGNELTSVFDPDHPETYDPTEFSYRLSFYSKSSGKYELANRYRYYVGNPEGKLCAWNPTQQKFVPTEYNAEHIDVSELPEDVYTSIMCYTSIYGKIDHIPADYTVYVPGLPVDSKFMVEERDDEVPLGYNLDKYDWVEGSYILEEEGVHNKGIVRANETPKMKVINERGYGITVEKQWTDEDFAEGYDPIYVALYENGVLLEDSIRQISYPDKTSYYYYTRSTDGIVMREVVLENPNPSVSEEGVVTNTGSVTPIEEGGRITINNTSGGETSAIEYTVGYEQGGPEGYAENVRTDIVTNTRPGGVALRLFKWDGTDPHEENPLEGGVFTLTCDGVKVGDYTSNSRGKIVILYDDFDPNKEYVLTQTSAPNGYIGLAEPISFKVKKDATDPEDVITLTNPNGPGWAKTTDGSNGILGFIDVYNKPYTLKVLKYNDKPPYASLMGAHFDVYKQVYTSIMGYSKARTPLLAYTDVVTNSSGQITIVSNEDNKTLKPGTYYLTEKTPPPGYEGLDEDVIFIISEKGEVTVDSEHTDFLDTKEVNGVCNYLIRVPNTKTSDIPNLTITKLVTGNMGNKAKEFTFTFRTTDGDTTEYEWTKNGEPQTDALQNGDTFTLSHEDIVVITMTEGANVTISEDAEGYTSTFKLNENDAVPTSTMPFTINGDTTLIVTNTLTAEIPTGVWISYGFWIIAGALMLAGMFFFRSRARRYKKEK